MKMSIDTDTDRNMDMDRHRHRDTDRDRDRDMNIITPLLSHHQTNFEVGLMSQFRHCVPVNWPTTPAQYCKLTIRCGLVSYSGSALKTNTISWSSTYNRIGFSVTRQHRPTTVRYKAALYIMYMVLSWGCRVVLQWHYLPGMAISSKQGRFNWCEDAEIGFILLSGQCPFKKKKNPGSQADIHCWPSEPTYDPC